MPKPTATGTVASALDVLDQFGQVGGNFAALAGGADGRDHVDESGCDLADLGAALAQRGRCDQRDHGQAGSIRTPG